MDPAAAALNASIDFDRRLLRDDVRGSQAHARMLAAVGLISAADAEQIVARPGRGGRGDRPAASCRCSAALEDIHMNVEARLTELIGEPGGGCTPARSRNDQVATDLRLYARRGLRRDRRRHRPARGWRCAGRRREHAEHAAARLHAPAARAGGDPGAPPAGLRRDAGARSRAVPGRRPAGRPSRRWARARWPAPACPSIARRRRRRWASPGRRRNSLDAVSDRDFAAEIAFAVRADGACTCRAWARSWCCGRPPSSGSCAWARATARAAR